MSRRSFKPNPIVIVEGGDTIGIILERRNGTKTAVYIDATDYPLVSQYRWRYHKAAHSPAYARTGCQTSKTMALMHNFILKTHGVDHKDGNGLNNRRKNLRLANTQQNTRNGTRRATNTSGFVGVSWYAPNQNWRAYARTSKDRIHIGYFGSKFAAAHARDSFVRKYYGEFATYNFPLPGERSALTGEVA